MENEELDLIKSDVLRLLEQFYKEKLELKDARLDKQGVNVIFDCLQKEAKAKILGKRGRNIKVARKMVKLFGFMHYRANINIFLLPDVERLQQPVSGKNN
jgi:predicted RNA-binding protein YlqC (UPF0109 family)